MAQGRGTAYPAAFILIMVGLQWQIASAATYTVGGSKGWDVGIDYTSWAGGLTFKVGDILFFPYVQALHNVVVVNKAGYDACSDANAISTESAGNTSVTLTTTGAHYYLCSVIGHCSAGMKLAVNVITAVSPTASPPATPPTPSKTPSSSPISAPSSAPAPAPASTSTPSSAPAPSSPVPAPASAPTPSTLAPTSGPSAPGSTPSTPAGTPPTSSPPPPNSAYSLLASTASMSPLFALWAALFI